MCSSQPGALFQRLKLSRWCREQFRWSLRWVAIRSSSGSLRALIARGTASPALLSWSMDWQPSRLNCCISYAQAAAAALGHKLFICNASTEAEIDSSFVIFGQQGVSSLFVDAEP